MWTVFLPEAYLSLELECHNFLVFESCAFRFSRLFDLYIIRWFPRSFAKIITTQGAGKSREADETTVQGPVMNYDDAAWCYGAHFDMKSRWYMSPSIKYNRLYGKSELFMGLFGAKIHIFPLIGCKNCCAWLLLIPFPTMKKILNLELKLFVLNEWHLLSARTPKSVCSSSTVV